MSDTNKVFRLTANRNFKGRSLKALSLIAVTLITACSSQNVAATDQPAESVKLGVPAAIAQQPSTTTEAITTEAIDNSDVLSAITPAQVIYLGETHTTEADHSAQLEIIQTLSEQNDIAIGLEMIQRPFQPVLDSYLAGEIDEAALIENSEYETRWGYDWELYAPIFRYAKDNQIPLIALNTPTEITRQVAREGLQSLSGDALTYIPPIKEIDTTDQNYRDSLADIFSAHGGSSNSPGFENFFAAQVLWDETMADAVVTQLQSEPDRQVIVLVGEGHVAYDYGIPIRVERRLPEIEQASVRLASTEDNTPPDFADFVWLTP